jgi:hypothetical protein
MTEAQNNCLPASSIGLQAQKIFLVEKPIYLELI